MPNPLEDWKRPRVGGTTYIVTILGMPLLLPGARGEASDPEPLFTASMAVVMMADPDDDSNVSWYAHGVIDGLVKVGAYRCPKEPQANRGQITAEAKRMAQGFVLVGKGETPFRAPSDCGTQQSGWLLSDSAAQMRVHPILLKVA